MIGGMTAAPRLAACCALIAAAGAACAGSVQVNVIGADGKPAADVVILVTPAAASAAAPAPETAVIAQRDIRFVPYVTVVPLGATVRFVNRDNFDHHIRSQPGGPLGSVPPAKQFEFRLARARGTTEPSAELKADVPGTVVLGCHIHNSMRGHLYIATTPYVAVTDDRGRATIANVPDGTAELRLWHPDQIVDQPAAPLQVAGTSASETKLNFTPRKRPPPVRKGEYDY
jgi:plastocyanin